MADDTDKDKAEQEKRYQDVLKLKKEKEKRRKNANKSILGDLEGPGQLVNLEKNYDPAADRGVVTNRTHTWKVELPTEHIGNEKDGPLCGRVRSDGNIYVVPKDATCKRCINVYKRMKKKNKKMQPIRSNIQPKAEDLHTESVVVENIKNLISSAIISVCHGEKLPFKFRASKEQLNVFSEALKVTKELYDAAQTKNVIAEQIMTHVVKKNIIAEKFKQSFGFSWPF